MLSKGKEPDVLFRELVRTSDGKILINFNFATAFLESRAYRISLYIAQYNNDIMAEYSVRMTVQSAMNDILTTNIKERMNSVAPTGTWDHFTLGNILGDAMSRTIDAAKELRATEKPEAAEQLKHGPK